jgi:hypothetical protein
LDALDTDGELICASGQFEEAVEVFVLAEEPDPLLAEEPDALLAEDPDAPFAEVHAEADVEVGMADQYLLQFVIDFRLGLNFVDFGCPGGLGEPI